MHLKTTALYMAAALMASTTTSVEANAPDSCKQTGHFAMCFDDGPTENTSLLLSELKDAKVTATFHVTGQYLNDPIVKANLNQIVEDGHILGIRSTPSWDVPTMSDEELKEGILKVRDDLEAVTGVTPKFIRFPYGEADARVMALVESLGMVATSLNLDAQDYSSQVSGQTVLWNFQSVLNKIEPGRGSFISAQHSANYASVDVTDEVIDFIQSKEYKLVGMDECRGVEGKYLSDEEGGDVNAGHSLVYSGIVLAMTSFLGALF